MSAESDQRTAQELWSYILEHSRLFNQQAVNDLRDLRRRAEEADTLRRELKAIRYEWAESENQRVEQFGRAEAAEQERDRLREALRKSAERLHGLSEDPEHLRHTFSECPAHECAQARAALDATSEEAE